MADDRQQHRVRAHQHAAGAKGAAKSALGRSRGGFGAKIHALTDALGNPVKFILTGGQEADCFQALPLLERETADAVLADKGYDAGYVVDQITAMGAQTVIPPHVPPQNSQRSRSVFI